MRFLAVCALLAALGACSISAEGIRISPPPPAVQGSDDVQGAPMSPSDSAMQPR